MIFNQSNFFIKVNFRLLAFIFLPLELILLLKLSLELLFHRIRVLKDYFWLLWLLHFLWNLRRKEIKTTNRSRFLDFVEFLVIFGLWDHFLIIFWLFLIIFVFFYVFLNFNFIFEFKFFNLLFFSLNFIIFFNFQLRISFLLDEFS